MSTVLRDARTRREVGVRELARRCGVAASTVLDWERSEAAGTIQSGTLARALEALGERLSISSRPQEPTPVRLDRLEQRLGLELHRAIATKLIQSPEAVLSEAQRRLPSVRDRVNGGAKDWVDHWAALIDAADLGTLIEVMLGTTQRDIDLRSVSPFTGLLSAAEREDVAARAMTS